MSFAKKYSIVSEPFTGFIKEKVSTSKQLADYFRKIFVAFEAIDIYESFYAAFLNRANVIVGVAKISQGGITGTVVDVKIMSKYIVDTMASSIVLCHNHPSGNIVPSNSDLDITNKIKNCANIFDTKLLDHIILTEESYYSFSDEGLI